jgi:general secretion pathway protein L
MLALGIDLCGDRLALALIDTSGRTPRLVGAWREHVASGDATADALRAAIARRSPRTPDAIATALPGGAVAHRILELPFADPRRLAATVPFEIESLVPFDLESGVSTFTVLHRTAAGATVLAAIARRDEIAAHLAQMNAAGVDPAIIDLGALATVGMLSLPVASALVIEPRNDGAVALVRGGRLASLRVIDAAGGSTVLAEAEWSALALVAGDPVPPLIVVGADGEVSARLATSLGARREALEAHLPGWATTADPSCLRAVALAARAAGVSSLGLNFRAGTFAYHAPREESRRQLRITAGCAAAAAVLAIVAAASGFAGRRAELARLESDISRSVTAVLPTATHGNELQQLQAAVDALEKRREMLEGGHGSQAQVLEVLLGISEAVPDRVPFQVDDCTVDDDGVRLHARTDSYESVDLLKRSLARVPGLRDPQVKDSKTGVDGRIEFRVTLAFRKEAGNG